MERGLVELPDPPNFEMLLPCPSCDSSAGGGVQLLVGTTTQLCQRPPSHAVWGPTTPEFWLTQLDGLGAHVMTRQVAQ